jgi:N6-L-threonylcarbamoyladenine synthase
MVRPSTVVRAPDQAGKPLIGVNHILAHVYGALLGERERLEADESWPMLALIVSGGHTLLIRVESDGQAQLIGNTLDDAAGEAFDKGAKILNLGYPGGPLIEKLAARGDANGIDFPRGLTGGGGKPLAPENRLNFSFSGLKTSLRYRLQDCETDALDDPRLLNIIAGYQEAIVDVLVTKTRWAAETVRPGTLLLGGGVACNGSLRCAMKVMADDMGLPLHVAPPEFCTDNAAMIAGLGYHQLRAGDIAGLDLDAVPRLGELPVVALR